VASTNTATRTAPASSTRTATPTNTVPTATRTRTGTTTPTPTNTVGAVCGNGFIEAGETCSSCPGDCTVGACTPTPPTQTFKVSFQAPLGAMPSQVAALVGYRSNRVNLPGMGLSASSRIKNRPQSTSQLVNDMDYAVQVVIGGQAGSTVPNGRLFTIDFDSCKGTAAVTPADFGCTIVSCGSSSGPIQGCTCTVTVP